MNDFFKRLFDIIFSVIGFLITLPVFLTLAAIVWFSDFGSIFYVSKRVGRKGKLFNLYKFRTMVPNADKIGPSSTAGDDPRITKIGHFLRKTKLDELPQLLNVMNGTMSFVGPRPQVKWAVDLYTEEERKVLEVRPGITDWASLKFHNEAEILAGSEDPDKAYMELIHPEKMRLGLEYVNKRSIFTDITILFQTFITIFRKNL